VGLAISRAEAPPPVWLQMSTATIYAHRFDGTNDELSGIIGGMEADAPGYWRFSVEIAKAWERALDDAPTPRTRRVAMRTAMVMSPNRGGVFDLLCGMTRLGLGGAVAGGEQYVSWIHDVDFVRAVDFLIHHDIEGPVNLSAPHPLPQRDFMKALRSAWGARFGLPTTLWMAQVGAFLMRSDTELLLKSRRVVPRRLLDVGFSFLFPAWPQPTHDGRRRYRRAWLPDAPPSFRTASAHQRQQALGRDLQYCAIAR
jgi:uncharacterized protein